LSNIVSSSYGDQGHEYIARALRPLFPAPSLDRDIVDDPMPSRAATNATLINVQGIYPLSPVEFHGCILIPYTSILLIQADRDCTFEQAKDVWQNSWRWGLHNSHLDSHIQQTPELDNDNEDGGDIQSQPIVKTEPVDGTVVPVEWPSFTTLDAEGNEVVTYIID
jgi:hypothetical protein